LNHLSDAKNDAEGDGEDPELSLGTTTHQRDRIAFEVGLSIEAHGDNQTDPFSGRNERSPTDRLYGRQTQGRSNGPERRRGDALRDNPTDRRLYEGPERRRNEWANDGVSSDTSIYGLLILCQHSWSLQMMSLGLLLSLAD
jgi:hypothetical protein